MNRYKLVVDTNAYSLTAKIERLLADGWECQGGVAIEPIFANRNKCFQAMVKKEKED